MSSSKEREPWQVIQEYDEGLKDARDRLNQAAKKAGLPDPVKTFASDKGWQRLSPEEQKELFELMTEYRAATSGLKLPSLN